MAFEFAVNYVAVLVATIVGMILGYVWYSPLLFANPWMKAVGLTKKQIEECKEKGMAVEMIGQFVLTYVLAFVLHILILSLNFNSAASGTILGLVIWVGFLATSQLNVVLWENKPFSLYFINTSYYFVLLGLMGAILGSW